MSIESAHSVNDSLEVQEPTLFKKQFVHKEMIRTAGGVSEVTDVSPESLEHETPLFLAPAWAMTADVYEPLIENFVTQGGRRVVTLDHPRIDEGSRIEESLGGIDIKKLRQFGRFAPEELRKALNILDVIKAKGLEKVDAVAHSEGALNAIFAAVLQPEHFRNIVLFAPAGLIGEDTLGRLGKGFAGQSTRAKSFDHIPKDETEKEVGARAGKAVLKSVFQGINAFLRSLREVHGISKSQIQNMISYLREQGIKVAIVSTEDDPVFPRAMMDKVVSEQNVDIYSKEIGGHGAIGDIPSMFGPKVINLLDRMEGGE